MANYTNAALYSPYGAYELKAKYQKNFMVATASMVAFVILMLVVIWGIYAMNEEDTTIIPSTVIKTIAELGPPPTVAKRPPQVQVQQPNVAVPKVGIPVPVADEQAMDDDVVLATKEELADIVAPDISASDASGDITVDIAAEEYLPGADEFVAVEVQPEMIYQEEPDYPRLAKQAGLEGVVWVKALVGKEGNVKDIQVAKSSGTPSLDEAALKAGMLCKFKPAIQNGRPVAIWVTFNYKFELGTGG